MLHLEAMPGTSYLPPPLVQFCSQDNHDINSTPSVKFMKANHEYAGVICFFRAQVAVLKELLAKLVPGTTTSPTAATTVATVDSFQVGLKLLYIDLCFWKGNGEGKLKSSYTGSPRTGALLH